MNRIFLLFCLLFTGIYISSAQQQTEIANQYLISKCTVEAPLERRHGDETEHILTGILAQSATASGSKYSTFALAPVVSLLEEGKIEGVKTLVTAKLNISIRAVNLISSDILGAFDIVVTGSGKNRAEAITKGIQQLRSKKPQMAKSISEIDRKVKDYYDTNCDKIAATATDLVQKKQYQAALALLHGVPATAGCYASLAAQKEQVFKSVQEQQCSNISRQADALIAANNFTGALNLLSQVDASAPCAADVDAKIAVIETKLDAAQKERWEWLFKFWETGAEAEKAKWNAYTAICLNWLRGSSKFDIIDK